MTCTRENATDATSKFFFAKFWYCNTSDIKWPGGMLDMFKNWDLGIGNHKISNGCTSIDWKRWLERWPNLTQVLCRQLTFTVPKVRNNFWIQNFVENQKSNWDCCNGMRQEWVFLFFCVMLFSSWKQNKEVHFFFGFHFFGVSVSWSNRNNSGASASSMDPLGISSKLMAHGETKSWKIRI